MKRKILAIVLTGLFFIGLLGIINTNPTNQEKNIRILQNTNAKVAEPVNCLVGGFTECPLWPEISGLPPGGGWYVLYQ